MYALALLIAGAPTFAEVSGVQVSCTENIRGKSGRARVELVAGAGALHEAENEHGLAHLVEHLIFRPLGFDHNQGATSWDYTAYFRDVRTTELSTAAIALVEAV